MTNRHDTVDRRAARRVLTSAWWLLLVVVVRTPATAQHRWSFDLALHGVAAGTETSVATLQDGVETVALRRDATWVRWEPWYWTRAEHAVEVTATARWSGAELRGIEQTTRWDGAHERRVSATLDGGVGRFVVDGMPFEAAVGDGPPVVIAGFASEWVRALRGDPRQVRVLSADGARVLCTGEILDQGAARFRTADGTILARHRRVAFDDRWVDVFTVDGAPLLVRESTGLTTRATGHLDARLCEAPPDVEEDDVRFASGDVRLVGIITRPRAGTPVAAAVLLSGSGPDDADARIAGHPFLDRIAWDLALRGVASIRFADRSVGGSGGDFSTIRVTDLCADARAALDALRRRFGGAPLALIGHSEGALIAARLAAEGAPVGLIVLLGCPSRPVARVLCEQIPATQPDEPGLAAEAAMEFEAVLERIGASHDPVLEIDGALRSVGWLRDHLQLDPAEVVGRVPCAVELFQGSADRQVAPEHVDRLEAVLRAAGRTDFAVHRLSGLDHAFMDGATAAHPGAPARTLDPRFRALLVDRVVAPRWRRGR